MTNKNPHIEEFKKMKLKTLNSEINEENDEENDENDAEIEENDEN
jgi:hypothetical protein